MSLEKLDLAQIAKMDDGRFSVAFDGYMQEAYDDIRDRPKLVGARRVMLFVDLVPVTNDAGELETVRTRLSFDGKRPKKQSRTYDVIPARGGLAVNELSPDDARQMTLDMAPGPSPANGEDDDFDDTEYQEVEGAS